MTAPDDLFSQAQTYTTTVITRYKNSNDVVIGMNVPVCIVMAVLYPDVPLKIKIKSK